MVEFKTTHYSSSPFSNKLFLSSNSPFTNKFFHQTALSQTSFFFFKQPGLNVNDGIADGTTAMMVAAMLGNGWAITRWGKCTTPSALGQEKKKTYRPDLLWEIEGQFQFNWMTLTAVCGQNANRTKCQPDKMPT